MFVGIAIFLIGLLMFVVGLILWGFKTMWNAISNIFYLIGYFIFRVYHHKNVENQLYNANWTKKELDWIDQVENTKKKEAKQKVRKEAYEGILLFSARMKSKYPFADRALFSKMENEFLQQTNINIFKQYEREIKESHEKNSKMNVYR